MIGIEKFHRDVRALLKQNKSAFVSPQDIDSFIYMATMDILDESVKRYKANGQGFSEDNDLIKYHSFSGSATERALPSDVHTVIGVFNGTTEGDLLDLSTYNDRLNSVILPPTATRPIATTYGTYILIEPATTTHKIKYFRIPATCNYAFTLSSNNPVYNPTGSIGIDLPLSLYSELLKKVLVYAVPITNNQYAGQLAST
jgi:hypothetical protein